MKPIAVEWIEKADNDYRAGALLRQSAEDVYDAISFHAQQCAEKYLKAWLSECEVDFPRTHDLEALAKLAAPTLSGLENVIDDLRFLTSFAVEIRYPGITAEMEDAEKCWQIVLRLRELVRSEMKIEAKRGNPEE
ncbi:MAG: HEPN domain-containing protein [Pyrinomonadaceae bacterium]